MRTARTNFGAAYPKDIHFVLKETSGSRMFSEGLLALNFQPIERFKTLQHSTYYYSIIPSSPIIGIR